MKKLLSVMVLVSLAACVSADDSLIRKATQALAQKDFNGAADACHAAVKAEPNDPAAWYTLGVVRWAEVFQADRSQRARLMPRLQEGHQALDRALALEPNFGHALLYKSLLFRLDAEMAGSPELAKPFIVRADDTIAKAQELKKSGKWKDSSAPVPPPPPPPPPKI